MGMYVSLSTLFMRGNIGGFFWGFGFRDKTVSYYDNFILVHLGQTQSLRYPKLKFKTISQMHDLELVFEIILRENDK